MKKNMISLFFLIALLIVSLPSHICGRKDGLPRRDSDCGGQSTQIVVPLPPKLIHIPHPGPGSRQIPH
jgi:hypothetical protein